MPDRPASGSVRAGGELDHRSWYEPLDILDAIDVKPGSTCVDLGCQTGAFTIPLAGRVGKDGRVYAVDSSVANLDLLKARKPGANMTTLRAELSDTRLPAAFADLVLAAFSLTTAGNPGAVLSEAARLLKPGGRLAVVEWRPVAPPPGPPLDRRIRNDRLQRLMETYGFSAVKRVREGAVYYTLSAEKGSAPAVKPKTTGMAKPASSKPAMNKPPRW